MKNSVIKKEDNRDKDISPNLLKNQVRHTSFKTYYRGFEAVAILLSQVLVQLIEPFLFFDKPLFKHLQFYHQILAFIQFKSIDFKVIAPAKTTAHKLFMNLPITDSFLV